MEGGVVGRRRRRIGEPRYLDERPAEAEGRVVPGHGEADLVIGHHSRSAVATLVERSSRFLILASLTGRDSLTVVQGVIAATGGLPASIRRLLTWDCGTEMARHASITATGLPVYFAHPHSPWERGSNENLNRIFRVLGDAAWFAVGIVGVLLLSLVMLLVRISADVVAAPARDCWG